MSDSQQSYARSIEVEHVIGGKRRGNERQRRTARSGKIIPRELVSLDPTRVCIVGGDTDQFAEPDPPTIIVEKKDGQIYRILVTCPCGRHAELVCEYEL